MNEPMGPSEVAEFLGVKRGTVDQWLHRGILEPRWRLVAGPLWDKDDVIAWARSTGRLAREDLAS
jgi:predicted site-specific integrase-resolvase